MLVGQAVRLGQMVLLEELHVLALPAIRIFRLLAVELARLDHLEPTQQAVEVAEELEEVVALVTPHLLVAGFRAAVLQVITMAAHLVQML
jgi:hypothetical protein